MHKNEGPIQTVSMNIGCEDSTPTDIRAVAYDNPTFLRDHNLESEYNLQNDVIYPGHKTMVTNLSSHSGTAAV